MRHGPERQGPHLTGPSLGLGASGEDEDEEVALDGEEGGAGPEEERPEGPEGERVPRGLAGLALRSGSPSPQLNLLRDAFLRPQESLVASSLEVPPCPPQEGRPLARVQKYTLSHQP